MAMAKFSSITPCLASYRKSLRASVLFAGGAVYSPAMTDFVVMVENVGQMFVTGPEVVKEVLSQEVSFEELGGARAHATKSGVAHFVANNEYDCFDK